MGRPIGPGWRLTLEALGLKKEWEPLPPPTPDPPAELVPAMLKEARARDMRTCPKEKRALTTPPGGRRTPPSLLRHVHHLWLGARAARGTGDLP